VRIHLEQLVRSVTEYIDGLDELMGVPPCHERGQCQAQLLNNLEIAKNTAQCFGLERVKPKKRARAKSAIRGIAPPHDHPRSQASNPR
jgi:hypothetical protein